MQVQGRVLFKPQPFADALSEVNRMPDRCLHCPQEAGVVAVTYAKARGLEAGAGSAAHLLLDADLSDALFKARHLIFPHSTA